MRPQEIGPLTFLAQIRFPFIVSLFPLFFWLGSIPLSWNYQTRVMMFFLVAEGLRTIVGKLVIDDLVRNDFWSFHIWEDLFFQFTTLMFPIVVFLRSGVGLRKFLSTWLFVGFFLGVYALTHSGVGPGGFLGDENDCGLALLVFLPFPMAYLTESRFAFGKKIRYFAVVAFVLLGIVATVSRGAFVGLVCVLAYFFFRSKRKVMLLLSVGMLLLVVVPFLPPDYISEMRTIKDTNSGTADIRKHYWKLSRLVWLDPKHFVFGVGLGNVSFHLGDYESGGDLETYPSAAGRAVHSMYFQLLPDLGCWGIFVCGSILLRSFRVNSKLFKQVIREQKTLARRDLTDESDEEWRSHRTLLRKELEFVGPMLMATNISFVALLSAGLFISVLYYPMFWLLVSLSSVLEKYTNDLLAIPAAPPLTPAASAVPV